MKSVAICAILFLTAAPLEAQQEAFIGWNDPLRAYAPSGTVPAFGICGIWGLDCQEEDPVEEALKKIEGREIPPDACKPIHIGFTDLGIADEQQWWYVRRDSEFGTGLWQGWYRVVKNQADLVSIDLDLPKIKNLDAVQIRLSIYRLYNPDSKQCEDYVAKQNLAIAPDGITVSAKRVSMKAEHTYNAKSDQGSITFREWEYSQARNKWDLITRNERYWEGNNGDKKMIIELKGNNDFLFKQKPKPAAVAEEE